MFGELLAEAFELDGRILRSIRALLIQPGHLSAEFSANRRASYVSPIRLYLFSSIVFFFLLSMTSEIPQIDLSNAQLQPGIVASGNESLSSAPLDQSRFRTMIDPALHDELDMILTQNTLAADLVRGAMEDVNERAAVGEPTGEIGAFFYNQMVKALADPSGLLADLFDNVPVALFFLLPVYAGILKLVYLRSGKYYVEHLVFALHLHAFAFIVFSAALFVPDTEAGWQSHLERILYLAFAVYYFLGLRKYYGQSRRKTGFKLILLTGIYCVCLGPAALLVLLVTFSTA